MRGDPEREYRVGDEIQVECITDSANPSSSVLWTRNGEQYNDSAVTIVRTIYETPANYYLYMINELHYLLTPFVYYSFLESLMVSLHPVKLRFKRSDRTKNLRAPSRARTSIPALAF